ncbi:hypothetical protein ACIJYD_03155 [Candidatus Pelagibacter bacterium nBUS_33]|uniref:hypothetical protein n=1 Tax=Candidatus Pelagibacter bacterium nBUS_33 TaxID=3374193 RepID=UPI003EBEAD1D
MKRILLILVLSLNFQSSSKADQINEISIEGLSVGDSALTFFTKENIDKNTFDYYKIKTFVPVQMDKLDFFKTYDAVDFAYRKNDSKYIITSLNGILLINDPVECEKKLDQIILDISPVFNDAIEIEKAQIIHDSDPSGKSKIIEKQWVLTNGDRILVQCYNFDASFNSQNHLSVSLRTKEFHEFLRKIAYKDNA